TATPPPTGFGTSSGRWRRKPMRDSGAMVNLQFSDDRLVSGSTRYIRGDGCTFGPPPWTAGPGPAIPRPPPHRRGAAAYARLFAERPDDLAWFQRGQHLVDGPSCWVAVVRPEVAQRHQHEGALAHRRVGNGQAAALNRVVAVEEQVQVDLAWAPVEGRRAADL